MCDPRQALDPAGAEHGAAGHKRDDPGGNGRGGPHRCAARCDVLTEVGDALHAHRPQHGRGSLDGEAGLDDDRAACQQASAGLGPFGGREAAPQQHGHGDR
jgi:hypothetical protein